MKKIFILFLLMSSLSFAKESNNFRCWSDPGLACVIKIDLENKQFCTTGCMGDDYSCKNSSRSALLTNHSKGQKNIEDKIFSTQIFKGHSADFSTQIEIEIFNESFPRPHFPQHQVYPANLKVNSELFGYTTMSWTRIPDGHFNWDSDFYCLSEKYFK